MELMIPDPGIIATFVSQCLLLILATMESFTCIFARQRVYASSSTLGWTHSKQELRKRAVGKPKNAANKIGISRVRYDLIQLRVLSCISDMVVLPTPEQKA